MSRRPARERFREDTATRLGGWVVIGFALAFLLTAVLGVYWTTRAVQERSKHGFKLLEGMAPLVHPQMGGRGSARPRVTGGECEFLHRERSGRYVLRWRGAGKVSTLRQWVGVTFHEYRFLRLRLFGVGRPAGPLRVRFYSGDTKQETGHVEGSIPVPERWQLVTIPLDKLTRHGDWNWNNVTRFELQAEGPFELDLEAWLDKYERK